MKENNVKSQRLLLNIKEQMRKLRKQEKEKQN
jgi:hypothetical protein